MHAIITRGLYIFYPLYEAQKRFFKEVFSENSALWMVSIQGVMMAARTVHHLVKYLGCSGYWGVIYSAVANQFAKKRVGSGKLTLINPPGCTIRAGY